ncbi:protein transport protein bos1 [Chytridiales sp. JEL 0842]|nr:protein transport protein bos1 [Chytridiales sp. JEL 0842]
MSGNILYNNAMKQVHQLRTDFEKLESQSSDPNSGSFLNRTGHIQTQLQSLHRAAQDIEDIAKREITTVKREKALTRAAQVRGEYQSIKEGFDAWKVREQAKIAAKEREDLLGGLSKRPGKDHLSDPNAAGSSTTDHSAILMMDGLLKENAVLESSGGKLDEYITMGRTALQELYDQRGMLKVNTLYSQLSALHRFVKWISVEYTKKDVRYSDFVRDVKYGDKVHRATDKRG